MKLFVIIHVLILCSFIAIEANYQANNKRKVIENMPKPHIHNYCIWKVCSRPLSQRRHQKYQHINKDVRKLKMELMNVKQLATVLESPGNFSEIFNFQNYILG